MKKIAEGAEAIIYLDGKKIIKKRIPKKYRLAELDKKLRKGRTKLEAKILRSLARENISVPSVIEVNEDQCILEMAFIEGEKIRDYLLRTSDHTIFEQIANLVEKMHSANVIHGDLTTSNMILCNGKVYLIDFGLANYSSRIEDKAVDLHLLKECLKSKHYKIWENAWLVFSENYKNKEILDRVKIVEKRGRYKKKAPI
ncbi:MAG: KEOPS complex kinase/ATPase Bud32 [Candidatus Nanoarchaeia archaeon]